MSLTEDPFSTTRRVITGVDCTGKSVIVRDEVLKREKGVLAIWGTDAPTTVGDATLPATKEWFPLPGGVRIRLSTRPPRHVEEVYTETDFHASNTADIIFILSGCIWLEVDDGLEVELRAGDVLVQNGVRHRWHNRSDEWLLMAVVVAGAIPRVEVQR